MSRLKGAIASIPKHKLLEGTVLEVLGNKMSIRLANNGRILVGIPYLGGPCSTGAAVKIDYSSGQPVAYAIGEAYVAPAVKKTIANSSKGSTSEPGRIAPAEHSFLVHTDVPDAYTDQANKAVVVNPDESGLAFVEMTTNGAIDAIVLHDVSTGTLTRYPVTSDGLDAASAAASSGDAIYLPPFTIGGDHTLKGGVSYLGQYVKSVTFTGKITMEANSRLYNATVVISDDSAGELVAIQAPTDGGAIIDYCIIEATQEGSGDAIVVKVGSSANGIVYLPRCSLNAHSTSGNGYAVYGDAGNVADIKIYWSSLDASTAVSNTNDHVFTYGCTYDTPTTHGTTMEGDGAVGSGGGSPDPQFVVDGVLYAPVTGVGGVYVAPRGAALDEVLVYLNDSGSAGNTVIDVHRNGLSIFDTAPGIAAGGVGVAQVFTPADTLCEALDIYTVDIDQAASGAKGLTVIIGFSGGSGNSGGASALFELSDVALSTPVSGDVLSYDGSQWTNTRGNGGKTRFAATLSGTHTPSNNTWGLIGFPTEVFDQGGYYDNTAGNYKWTPPAGTVMVTLLVEWSNLNANGQSVAIYKNGSALQTMTHRVATAYNHGHQIVVIDEADGDDYYQAYSWRWDGNGAIANTNGTRFSGVCL